VTARYSIFSLARHALGGHRGWPVAWRSPEPQPAYDVVIVGGGGHGLATAYYLALNHGPRRIAVLEKGWLGGGNTGRNTTIVRSDYRLPESADFMEFSLQLWEGLSQALNFNVMLSQRSYIDLAHSDGQLEDFMRRGNAMRLRGIDAELLDRAALERLVPPLDLSPEARFPVVGGLMQPRGGTARHDAVAWGYARAADGLGVDIVEDCEVTGIEVSDGRVSGVETSRGRIGADQVAISVAGNSSHVAALAGLRLPIETASVQAFVSEPVKPVLDRVVCFNAGMSYVSQTDKGEILLGGDSDPYNSYAQRGSITAIEETLVRAVAMFPFLSRLRMMRSWGGIGDISMDGLGIVGKTPVSGLYLNGGWGYSGFKATPAVGWTLAHTIAHDAPHELNAPFALARFERGALIDEAGIGPAPSLH
jgi:sarcosine oxidase subunit beta